MTVKRQGKAATARLNLARRQFVHKGAALPLPLASLRALRHNVGNGITARLPGERPAIGQFFCNRTLPPLVCAVMSGPPPLILPRNSFFFCSP